MTFHMVRPQPFFYCISYFGGGGGGGGGGGKLTLVIHLSRMLSLCCQNPRLGFCLAVTVHAVE